MRILYVVITILFLSACSTKQDDKVTITGTRVDRSEFDDKILISVKPEKGETIMDMISVLNNLNDMPNPKEFNTCQELKDILSRGGIIIKSIKEREIIAISPSNRTVTYKLKSTDNCLE